AEALAGGRIANVTFNNPGASPFARTHFCADFVEIFLVAGGKIVEAEDVLIELKKGFENVRADETCDASDEPGAGSSAKRGLKFVIEHLDVFVLSVYQVHNGS